jgi:hypothetical protein
MQHEPIGYVNMADVIIRHHRYSLLLRHSREARVPHTAEVDKDKRRKLQRPFARTTGTLMS